MLSRALVLLVGAATLVVTTGCTGLTKPEQISIIAEPPPEPAAKAAQAPAGAAQRPAAPAPQPEQAPGCGE